MAEINYKQILDGVTLALHRAYPNARIHSGTVSQDLQAGDYNVLPVTVSHTAQLGTRAQRKVIFDIVYYPTDAGGCVECLEQADNLPKILGTVITPNGDAIHCLSFEHTVSDNVLHCTVAYPFFVYDTQTNDSMEILTIE